jgi:carboxyl-terminal processing protease
MRVKGTFLNFFVRTALWAGLAFGWVRVACAAETPPEVTPDTAPVAPTSLESTADLGNMMRETKSVVYCLEKTHYSQKQLSDLDQNEILQAYMSDLDPLHLFLLETDVKGFQDKYAPSLADSVRELGDLGPAFAIFEKTRDRVKDRVDWINKRLSGNFDLTSKDMYQPDRTDLPWPATQADADKLWEEQLRFEVINELLDEDTAEIGAANKKKEEAANAGKAASAAPKSAAATQTVSAAPATKASGPTGNTTTATAASNTTVAATPAVAAKPKTEAEKLASAKDEIRKRYNSYLHSLDETEADEVEETFLNTLTTQYDPHSSFFSEHQLEDFDITMRNSLVGIGALLQDKDGYCLIHELLPGGPAEKSGLIHPGDKIIGVGQADGDIVDVVGAKLRKTVNMIRGTAGTPVRLLIIPGDDPGGKKTITLTREEIKLTTNLAKAEIIEVPEGNETVPIGVIDLPAFYGKGGGDDDFSTTDDVRELIGKLKAAGVQGLVIDLRRNGGGFLNEAIDLTGLFIPSNSPVLQVRNTLKELDELDDKDSKIAWDGPLLLLVSKDSASATEIFAGALQDYHRALVVGDHNTHGKGTVQAVYQFDKFDPEEKGAAKVTVQKWYLPDGNSIQSKGIAADIVLPSTIDYLPIGEVDEKHALPWDSVTALPLSLQGDGPWRSSLLDDKLVSELRDQSLARQKSMAEFAFLNDRIAWEKSREQQKLYSLDYDVRLTQRKDDIAFRDQLKARVEALSKDNFKSTDILLEAAKAQDKDKTAATTPAPDDTDKSDDSEDTDTPVVFDIQLRESLRIMSDWLKLEAEQPKPEATMAKLAANKDASTTTATAGTATQVLPSAPSAPAVATPQ